MRLASFNTCQPGQPTTPTIWLAGNIHKSQQNGQESACGNSTRSNILWNRHYLYMYTLYIYIHTYIHTYIWTPFSHHIPSESPLRWEDVVKFLGSMEKCGVRHSKSLRVHFVVTTLKASSSGFRRKRWADWKMKKSCLGMILKGLL